MLKNKCYLQSIRKYEDRTQNNVINFLDNFSINNIIQLLCIIYDTENEDEICKIIDSYISEDKDLFSLYEEVKDIILGYKSSEVENNTSTENEEPSVIEDVSNYKFLSDFYMHLCMQLMSLGMSYSEFWSLTTKEMYQAYSAIREKELYDMNKSLYLIWLQSGYTGAAFAGKLPKQAPQIDINEVMNNNEDEIINTPLGEMTRGDWLLYQAMETKELNHNRQVSEVK